MANELERRLEKIAHALGVSCNVTFHDELAHGTAIGQAAWTEAGREVRLASSLRDNTALLAHTFCHEIGHHVHGDVPAPTPGEKRVRLSAFGARVAQRWQAQQKPEQEPRADEYADRHAKLVENMLALHGALDRLERVSKWT